MKNILFTVYFVSFSLSLSLNGLLSQFSAFQEHQLSLNELSGVGEKCVDKVTIESEVVYEDYVECHHRISERCHVTYSTSFDSQAEEHCQENFKKSCYIGYKKKEQVEEFEYCHTPFICEGNGPTECRTVYESECQTKYDEQEIEEDQANCSTVYDTSCFNVTRGYKIEEECRSWPKKLCNTIRVKVIKYNPITTCKKKPRELCGPSSCVPTPGPQECFLRKENTIVEIPEETCNLEPDKSCNHVTKLIPALKAIDECIDVPNEVCVHSSRNPKAIQKPVVKKWCYIPSENSSVL